MMPLDIPKEICHDESLKRLSCHFASFLHYSLGGKFVAEKFFLFSLQGTSSSGDATRKKFEICVSLRR